MPIKYCTLLVWVSLLFTCVYAQEKPSIKNIDKIIIRDIKSGWFFYESNTTIVPSADGYILTREYVPDVHLPTTIDTIKSAVVDSLIDRVNQWKYDTLSLQAIELNVEHFSRNATTLVASCDYCRPLGKKKRAELVRYLKDSTELLKAANNLLDSHRSDDYAHLFIDIITNNDTLHISSAKPNFGMLPLNINNSWLSYDLKLSGLIAPFLSIKGNKKRLCPDRLDLEIVENLYYNYIF